MDPLTLAIALTVPIILSVVQFITAVLPAIAAGILNWIVTAPISFTKEPIVTIGWAITRDFANLLLVLALVVIGLATILRLESYGMKKALPMFIIVALLINFTPVICGVILDGANIIMNAFKDRALSTSQLFIQSNALRSLAQTEFGIGFWEKLWNFLTGGFLQLYLETVSKALVGILFNVFAFLILLAYALVFILRYVVIWVLVILSPLAWVGLIFPATKSWWETWFKQFIQWAIIGIPLFFFLYLAGISLGTPICKIGGGALEVGAWDWLSGPVLCSILSFLVPLFLLIIGLFLAMQAGDIGAKAIISGAKKGGKIAGKWAGKQIERRGFGPAAGKTAAGLTKAAAWAGRLETRGVSPLIAKPLRWMTRGAEMAAVPPLTEYAAKKRRVSLPEGWKQMSIPEKERYIEGLAMGTDKTVLASEMKGEGTFQKTSDSFKNRILWEVKKLAGDPRYLKETGDIFDAFPNKITKDTKLDLELAGVPEIQKVKKRQEIQDKIKNIVQEYGISEDQAAGVLHAKELKPRDIEKVAKDSLKSLPFQLATQKMSSSHLQALRNSFDEETVHMVLEQGKGLNTIDQADFKKISKENPRLARWAFETPAGREMLNWSTRFQKP